MRLLLDTHVLLWCLKDDKTLSREERNIIRNRANEVWVSAASAWEISIKQRLGKLDIPFNLEEGLILSGFQSLPITIPHALLAGELPLHHTDPFDRMLIAQAKIEGLTFVTHDSKQKLYGIPVIET